MSLTPPAPTDAPAAGDEEKPETAGFTLAVVSPSTGVPSPLTFSDVSTTMTVGQLKAKIRNVIPSNPSNETQRLIHRGRLLGRETDTMLDIFGEEALQNQGQHTLHLVLRPTGPEHPPIHPYTNPPTPIVWPQRVTTPISSQARPQSTPANPNLGMHTQQPLPGFTNMHHTPLPQAEQLQGATQRLQGLHREAVRLQQEMLNIEQRILQAQGASTGTAASTVPPPPGLRASQSIPIQGRSPAFQELLRQAAVAEGNRNTHQDNRGEANMAGLPRNTLSGRSSPNLHRPDHSATYTREGVGPNGERWHMTVSESTSTIPLPPHPNNHYQNNSHHAQGGNAALENLQTLEQQAHRAQQRLTESFQHVINLQNRQNNIGGAASNLPQPPTTAAPIPQPNLAPHVPTATGPGTHGTAQFPQPPSEQSPPSTTFSSTTITSTHGIPGPRGPIVYILSSPRGPQAILLQNSNIYHTHQSGRRQHEWPAPVLRAQAGVSPTPPAPPPAPQFQGEAAQRLAQPGNHQQQDENAPLEPIGAPHANPAAGALGGRIGATIWLIMRLAGFIWFCTSGNTSWLRFLMISTLAVIMFIINTGILNGIAEALWAPIRRHVDALIPLAGPEAALVPAINAAAIPAQPRPEEPGNQRRARRRHGELDEAEVAARIILEQRRQANGGWFLAQIRRVEHAALLFLASLVPGVGERHIAAREAEANAAEAARQRLAEAEAAAEDADNAENAEDGNAEGGNPGPVEVPGGEATHRDRENQAPDGDRPEDPGPGPNPPLVEV